ncbi:Pleckstrin homology domain [Plasmopara halstedii]|uniref:Pleckstrin homology domain n=1 Tax=Plasmopara halstedii TaxID=4781 RepID=A0A0P1AL73_PLAHL|nr:Pleckstrin homology domain [Plasmopara halstedii]CEG41631.1 Pleckstrin homology domain [Plasmopara halstedii]|eukprot:XP_024578000.1 Pleckstrin homology domain [Plasmopara halstedii]
MNSEDAPEWVKAINTELKAHLENVANAPVYIHNVYSPVNDHDRAVFFTIFRSIVSKTLQHTSFLVT